MSAESEPGNDSQAVSLTTPREIADYIRDFYLRDPEGFFAYSLVEMARARRNDIAGITIKGAPDLAPTAMARFAERTAIITAYQHGLGFGYLYYQEVAALEGTDLPTLTPELEKTIAKERHTSIRLDMITEENLPPLEARAVLSRRTRGVLSAIPEPLRIAFLDVIVTSPLYIGRVSSERAFVKGIVDIDRIYRRPTQDR